MLHLSGSGERITPRRVQTIPHPYDTALNNIETFAHMDNKDLAGPKEYHAMKAMDNISVPDHHIQCVGILDIL